jgi:hypothetical protein
MTEQGYGIAGVALDEMTEAEKMKFMTHEDLVLLLPLVSEANHISEELQKPVHFDIRLQSKLKNGVFHAEVLVQVKHSDTQSVWLWGKEKFVNRCYIMREIWDLYAQGGGGVPPELAQEQDPFWDPVRT